MDNLFLSRFASSIIERGVSEETVLLVLMIPLVVTIVAIFRNVIGISSLGIYIPTLLTLTFVVVGVYTGLATVLLIVCIGTGTRLLLRPLRLLYVPRMALITTMISIVTLALFYVTVNLPSFSFVSVSIFPIFISIMMVEEFMRAQFKEGARTALILVIETVVIALLGFFVVNLQYVKSLLLAYPELLIVTVLINIGLGRWTGVRLWEYYRFRDLIKAIGSFDQKV